MGFLRDLGAAASIGISATTKQKDAEVSFQKAKEKYEKRVEGFNAAAVSACSRFEELEQAWNEAKTAIIEPGALTVDPQGNLSWGWYQPPDQPKDPAAPADAAKTVSGSLPGLAAFIGAPATTWTLVGLFGTAGTGIGISSLSGAAFTAATAAWLGRMGISGITGLGMRAAPAVLGGIGLAISLPIQVAIGAKVAGDRERKTISQIKDTTHVIDARHTIIDEMQPRPEDLGSQAREQNLQLLRGTAQLQAVLNIHDKDATETKDAVNNLLQMLVSGRELCSEMKQVMDDIERRFRLNPFPTFS